MNSDAQASFRWHHQVAFHETDLAGLAHFSNYFRWMETAGNEFLESLGFPVAQQNGATSYGWPRVRASADFHAPAYFRDKLEIDCFVEEIKEHALAFRFRVYALRETGGGHLATGRLTTVLVEQNLLDRGLQVQPLWPELRAMLAVSEPAAWKPRFPKP